MQFLYPIHVDLYSLISVNYFIFLMRILIDDVHSDSHAFENAFPPNGELPLLPMDTFNQPQIKLPSHLRSSRITLPTRTKLERHL